MPPARAYLQYAFFKKYILGRMQRDSDEHEESLRYITKDGEAELEAPPERYGGHLDAVFIATNPMEGRIRDHDDEGTKYGTIYTIRFESANATNTYAVPKVMLHFLEQPAEEEAPTPITPVVDSPRYRPREAPDLAIDRVDPKTQLIVALKIKFEQTIAQTQAGADFFNLSDKEKGQRWIGATTRRFTPTAQQGCGTHDDHTKGWDEFWRALVVRYNQGNVRAQLAALGSARFSSSGDFRDFNTSQLIKFLALHGGQGSWDRALAGKPDAEKQALFEEYGDLVFDTVSSELAATMALERVATLQDFSSLEDVAILVARLVHAHDHIGGSKRPVLNVTDADFDTPNGGAGGRPDDAEYTLIVPKVRASGHGPPGPCKFCAAKGKPSEMHWQSDCPYNPKKPGAAGRKPRVLPETPSLKGVSCFRCGSPKHRVSDCPKPAPVWKDDDDSE
jgi:hypothetical protein